MAWHIRCRSSRTSVHHEVRQGMIARRMTQLTHLPTLISLCSCACFKSDVCISALNHADTYGPAMSSVDEVLVVV